MVILPWTSGLASVEAVAAETLAANEVSGVSPLDALLEQKREGDGCALRRPLTFPASTRRPSTANVSGIIWPNVQHLPQDGFDTSRTHRRVSLNAQPSAIISLAGLVIPLGLGAALAVPIYHEFSDGDANFGLFCLFIAVVIVLCRILTLLKLLDTTVGVVTLSVGVGNDVVGWVLLALTVALINASDGLTALWVLLAGVAYILFALFPLRWAYRWLAKKSGSLDGSTPSAMMMTVTILVGGFVTGLIIPHDNGYAISLSLLLRSWKIWSLSSSSLCFSPFPVSGYVVLICTVAFFSKFLGCAVTAKLCGFKWRESGAIEMLMGCKGRVELIALNIDFQAGILDTRTFSMFVLHAVLTFMTTPLTILFYPPNRHDPHPAAEAQLRKRSQTASTAGSITNEKAALSEAHGLPVLPHAIFKSHEAENLAYSDPILAILKTYGYLNRMNVFTWLAGVDYEDFSENVSRHTRATGSQTRAANEVSGALPFDALFQHKREGDACALRRPLSLSRCGRYAHRASLPSSPSLSPSRPQFADQVPPTYPESSNPTSPRMASTLVVHIAGYLG
ncbi:hypothetical protein C8Q76DRAFT_791166 [Earliella scabrosa]|nr:hypothetical protein C8Q76DRAFT_791166 [Earliella scabrosa]